MLKTSAPNSSSVFPAQTQSLFYRGVLDSISRNSIAAWYGGLTVQLRSQITRLVGTAINIMQV